jgi:hypothetical protein
MIPSKLVLNPSNTFLLRALGLTKAVINDDSSVSQIPVNNATLTGTLFNANDNPVTGLIDIVFTPIGSPPVGDYVGQYDASFDPPPGGDYYLALSGTASGGVLYLEIDVEIETRNS